MYWAGIDKNWDYANYQIEKIRVAIKNGLERRPKRAASAESFLADALPAMEKIVNQRDSTTFLQAIQTLTTSCNACHAKEKVPFFTVNLPVARQSSNQKVMFKKIVTTDSAPTTLLIRLMVGVVFLSEGIQKFLFADKLGSGRFEKIGLPNPEFLGSHVSGSKDSIELPLLC